MDIISLPFCSGLVLYQRTWYEVLVLKYLCNSWPESTGVFLAHALGQLVGFYTQNMKDSREEHPNQIYSLDSAREDFGSNSMNPLETKFQSLCSTYS